MSQFSFKGTGVALVTPFNSQEEVDYQSLRDLVDFVIYEGVDFLVALGTTSEAATLTSLEKEKVVNTIIEQTENRVPVVLGLGGNNTKAVVEDIKTRDFTNIAGILSVAPYYNKPNQEGIKAHFSAIAEACPIPIILYNVPGRTSSNIAADTVLYLAQTYKNIVAVKEASADFDQIMTIIQHKPEHFKVLSGDDGLTLPLLSVGVEGVISVVANVWPEPMVKLVNEAENGNYDEAKLSHYEMKDLIANLFAEGNPAGIKAALQNNRIIENDAVRLPLVRVSDRLRSKISENLK
jgi:4-hydroxy-tetrahydrodipicolinate synthase